MLFEKGSTGTAITNPLTALLSRILLKRRYRQRYDMEHLFRFGKQRLLMTSYLTPDVQHARKLV